MSAAAGPRAPVFRAHHARLTQRLTGLRLCPARTIARGAWRKRFLRRF